jgi:hypothetical protein
MLPFYYFIHKPAVLLFWLSSFVRIRLQLPPVTLGWMDGCNGHRLATQTATVHNRPHNLYILGTTATDYHNTATTHHNTAINFFAPQPCRGHNRRNLVLPTAIFDCMITRNTAAKKLSPITNNYAAINSRNNTAINSRNLHCHQFSQLRCHQFSQHHCSSTYPQQHCSSTIHNNTAHQLPTTTSLTAAYIHPQPCHNPTTTPTTQTAAQTATQPHHNPATHTATQPCHTQPCHTQHCRTTLQRCASGPRARAGCAVAPAARAAPPGPVRLRPRAGGGPARVRRRLLPRVCRIAGGPQGAAGGRGVAQEGAPVRVA